LAFASEEGLPRDGGGAAVAEEVVDGGIRRAIFVAARPGERA